MSVFVVLAISLAALLASFVRDLLDARKDKRPKWTGPLY